MRQAPAADCPPKGKAAVSGSSIPKRNGALRWRGATRRFEAEGIGPGHFSGGSEGLGFRQFSRKNRTAASGTRSCPFFGITSVATWKPFSRR